MSRDARKPVFGEGGVRPGATQFGLYNHRCRLEARNVAISSKGIVLSRVAKTKALISRAVTAQLSCAFVFADAKIRFSHEAAQFI